MKTLLDGNAAADLYTWNYIHSILSAGERLAQTNALKGIDKDSEKSMDSKEITDPKKRIFEKRKNGLTVFTIDEILKTPVSRNLNQTKSRPSTDDPRLPTTQADIAGNFQPSLRCVRLRNELSSHSQGGLMLNPAPYPYSLSGAEMNGASPITDFPYQCVFQANQSMSEGTFTYPMEPSRQKFCSLQRNANDYLKSKRTRTVFTATQLERLEAIFSKRRYMIGDERAQLAKELNLRDAQVKIWFQNRRIRWRNRKIHVDASDEKAL